jgi:penicillin-binding protein 1C
MTPSGLRAVIPAKRHWPRRLAILAVVTGVLGGTALWLDRAFPPMLDRYYDRSAVVRDRDGGMLRAYTARDGIWRIAAGPDDVSPVYLAMLKAFEDKRFDDHLGVDPLALFRAAGQMVAHGRIVSGGSTLTMQTVRLLEPRPRTLLSKLIEIGRALQLEAHYSKAEILGIYLTLAPYGGNIEGVRAASLAYFGREPTVLSAGEAALLVALPQSPTRLRPDRFPEAARAARDRVLARAAEGGVLDPVAAREAAESPTPDRRAALPFHAPHLADRLVARAPGRETYNSFVDGALQAGLEALAARALETLPAAGNLAIVAVDNDSRAITAYVGSAAFFDAMRQGQVDLGRAVRSPGSTLKPFIYGMGFEDRIILPETLIADLPTRFGDYVPTNFEGGYAGDVTVREALGRSLNIPAVAVLDRVGPVRFAARLRAAGTPLRFDDATVLPSLPIALGGGGLSLLDLARLYTALADGGVVSPLRWSPDDPPPSDAGASREIALLDPAAAWYVTEILAGAPPPDAMVDPAGTRRGRRIAYKTGTSYGFRDAWAIGYDARHTIAVWVGRADGAPNPDRYGRNTAAPLLFRAFALLPPPVRDVVGPRPAGAPVMAASALPPRLRRLSTDALDLPPPPGLGQAEPLVIGFPADGSEVERPRGAPLSLVARGGRRPLRWLVDGRPLASSPLRRDADWADPGAGQARITVIDAAGRTATARVWLR